MRAESKVRARALQLLYAWELQGCPDIAHVVHGMLGLGRGRVRAEVARAEGLASAVVSNVETLDAEIVSAVEGWRWERIGVVERNILRLAYQELLEGETPPRVVIDEAVQLGHWFGGDKTHAFINGVLDQLARRLGRL
jgi:transcription antitermination protein NusB